MSISARTLVLLPGLMCDDAVWAPSLTGLPAGWEPWVADYGLCNSLLSMAEAVLAGAPQGPFALAGHSMGGRVALEVVRLAPQRVSHLALLDTGHTPRAAGESGDEEARKRYALLEVARTQGVRSMAQTWVQGMVAPDRLMDAELMERIVAMFERKSAEVFAAQIQALLHRPDASEVLRSVAVPTLLQCGAQDAWSPPAQHEAMRVCVPHAALDLIENAGHMAPMEQPHAVAASLSRWLMRTGEGP